MSETGSRNDPYSAFEFLLEIDGVTVAGFYECCGLTTQTGIIDYRKGDENITYSQAARFEKIHQYLAQAGSH